MKKLTEFEKYLILEGLDKVKTEMVAEIEAAEKAGNRPIMATGFVEMTINELKTKLKLDK